MTSCLKFTGSSVSLPEEVSSFLNIQSTFPNIYESGTDLLAKIAGMIQHMRLETEIFPTLLVEENKANIKQKEKAYIDLSKEVTKYRETLESVNGQIERAIKLCSEVPVKDVRTFTDAESTTMKVYDFCQQIMPTLSDWHNQGSLLHKRFELILTYDKKNYNESMSNFSAAIKPATWSFSGITYSLTGYLFPQPEEASKAASADVGVNTATDAEKKK